MATKKKKPEVIIGYKAFDNDFKCKGMQYKVGETFTHKGKIKLCDSGLHFVENPLDVFSYYPPTSKFAEVSAEGVSKEISNDSKRVARKLTVKAEISLHSLIECGVKFILSKVDFENAKETNTGYRSAATNTGDRSAATNTGYRSAATNTGDRSAATNTGDCSAATVEGKESVAIAIGYKSKASGKKGCWLTLAEWNRDANSDYHIIDVQTTKVDGKKIKAGTFYQLKNGAFVEAE